MDEAGAELVFFRWKNLLRFVSAEEAEGRLDPVILEVNELMGELLPESLTSSKSLAVWPWAGMPPGLEWLERSSEDERE